MKDFKEFFEINKLHDQFHKQFPEENQAQYYYPDDSCLICYPDTNSLIFIFNDFGTGID
jgi:hypothetical protein